MASTGSLLKAARTQAGLTQAELARRLGTTQTAVSRLERRDANPRIATLQSALLATGHRLQLEAVAALNDVDEAQIAAHLRMMPAERAQAHDAAYRNVARTARATRRVD